MHKLLYVGGDKLLLNKIIVTNYGENSLSIIDKEDISQINTLDLKTIIPSKTGSTRVIADDNSNLLVLNCDDDCLYKVDVSNYKILNQLSLGRCPVRMKILGDKIYVLNIDSNSLSIIDTEDFTIMENIYVGEKPTDLAIDEVTGKVYITNLNSYSISIIDHYNGDIEEIKLSFMPFRIKIHMGIIYVLGFLNNNTLGHSILSSFDATEKKPKWSKTISGIYFDFIRTDEREYFYLVDSENSWLYGFDGKNEENNKLIYIGGLTNFLNYEMGNLYLNDMVNNQIVIVDIIKKQIKKRIAVGIEPHDILLT